MDAKSFDDGIRIRLPALAFPGSLWRCECRRGDQNRRFLSERRCAGLLVRGMVGVFCSIDNPKIRAEHEMTPEGDKLRCTRPSRTTPRGLP